MTSPLPRILASTMAAALLLAGCSTQVQTTSGGDFVAARPEWSAQFSSSAAARARAPAGGQAIDRAVFDAARAEPLLRFPARIGLARIQGGALTSVPAAEADAWLALVQASGAGYGEFVAVSPLVAQMTANAVGRDAVRNAVDLIRVGAARQHLDAVLIYEVGSSRRDSSTALSILDLTVIGAFLMPSRALEGRATAAAMLIDVRNGYPYGTALAQAERGGVWTSVGSTARSQDLTREAEAEAVQKLTAEVGTMMARLRTELAALGPVRGQAGRSAVQPAAAVAR